MIRNILVLAGALFTLSCSGSKTDTAGGSAESVFDGVVAALQDGAPNTVAGVTFRPPSDWTDNGPSGMRKAEYSFGPVAGETEPAVMTVFYFGPGQGGDVKSNLDRWIGQISPPEEGAAADTAVMREFAASEMPVSTVEVCGTYSASMGGPMSGNKVAKENYRLYGAVVQGPEGNVFFKLTGPDKSAAAMAKGFANLIHTVEKSSGETE